MNTVVFRQHPPRLHLTSSFSATASFCCSWTASITWLTDSYSLPVFENLIDSFLARKVFMSKIFDEKFIVILIAPFQRCEVCEHNTHTDQCQLEKYLLWSGTVKPFNLAALKVGDLACKIILAPLFWRILACSWYSRPLISRFCLACEIKGTLTLRVLQYLKVARKTNKWRWTGTKLCLKLTNVKQYSSCQ